MTKKRFSLSEIRVDDSDDDSEESRHGCGFPQLTRTETAAMLPTQQADALASTATFVERREPPAEVIETRTSVLRSAVTHHVDPAPSSQASPSIAMDVKSLTRRVPSLDFATDESSSATRSGARQSSPPIRVHPHLAHIEGSEESDSDTQSVQFMELGDESTSECSGEGKLRACGVMMDDGREETPDSYISDELPNQSQGDMPLVPALSIERSVGPATGRGESMTGRSYRSMSHLSGTTGTSLFRQRLLEKQQAEERRRQDEVEQQWQELTFQPIIASRSNTVHYVNAQPYHVRLFMDAKNQQRRRSQSRQRSCSLANKPRLSERTVELAGTRTHSIFERLFPEKPKKEEPPRVVHCGSKAVVERLLRCTSPKFKSVGPRRDAPFKPTISKHAKELPVEKNVIERLYQVKKPDGHSCQPSQSCPASEQHEESEAL